jgi:hypothetical protein
MRVIPRLRGIKKQSYSHIVTYDLTITIMSVDILISALVVMFHYNDVHIKTVELLTLESSVFCVL